MIKIKRRIIFGILTLSLLVILNSFVSADVLNVCSSNCSYATIQSAINNAGSGDKINVSAETYSENIIINKSLTLEGTGESVIDSNSLDGIDVQANNVVIDGFKIINSDRAIIISKESASVIVKNNYLDGNNYGVYILNTSSLVIEYNSIKNNQIGVYSNENLTGTSIEIKNNDFSNNINIRNDYNGINLNAEENYYGQCKPDLLKIIGNVDYSPWIGVCIKNSSVESSCILSNKNLKLNATIDSVNSSCVGKVIFQINSNNTLKNYSATFLGSGVYYVTVSNFVSGETVQWKVYVDDCFNHSEVLNGDNFDVQKSTSLAINPAFPDGINNSWYITEPVFTLDNPDASQIYYKWDGNGIFSGNSSFGLQNTPNENNITGGILKLTYWSNLSCGVLEDEQFKMFKFDFYNPVIEPLTPFNNQTINVKRPQIKIILNDVYNENSGINLQSIILRINSNLATGYSISKIGRFTYVTYNPNYDLLEGLNEIDFSVKDNAGRESQLVWNFEISTTVPDFNISIHAPMNGDQNSRRVKVNVSTTRIVDSIEYIDYSEKNPKYKSLCRNCNGYGNSREVSINIQEGINNLTFRAVDNGNEKKQEVAVFVDSKAPKIISTEPKVGLTVNGSRFSVKYEENNLQTVNFYYLDKKITRTDCESGKNKVCDFSIPASELVNYSGKYIEYWFEIGDRVKNASSKKTRVKVDIITPVINITSPANLVAYRYSQRVLFNLTASEDSKIDYYDNSELNPMWKRLCVKCSKYSSLKLIKKGNHDLFIRATDAAGNSDTEQVSFSVI